MNDEALNEELKQMYGREAAPARVLSSETLRAPISALRLKEPLLVPPTMLVRDAIQEMKRRHHACLMVVEHDKLAGIFTERDVLTRVAAEGRLDDKTTLSEVMTREPSTLYSHQMIGYALNFMHVGGFRHVPVVDDRGRPQGVVAVRDILAYLAEFFPAEVHNLPPSKQADHMPIDGG